MGHPELQVGYLSLMMLSMIPWKEVEGGVGKELEMTLGLAYFPTRLTMLACNLKKHWLGTEH